MTPSSAGKLFSPDYSQVTPIKGRALRSKHAEPEFNVQSSRLKIGNELKR